VRKPAQIEVAGQNINRPLANINLYGFTYKVLRHPSIMIPAHIEEWIEQYESDKNLPIPLDGRHPCWNDLKKEYEAIERGLQNGQR
jgi:hypothetical protein